MKNWFTSEERKEKIAYLLGKGEYSFDDLVLIVMILRGEGGCPWDIEQTHKSVRKCLIEEAYEVIEAIDKELLSGVSYMRSTALNIIANVNCLLNE